MSERRRGGSTPAASASCGCRSTTATKRDRPAHQPPRRTPRPAARADRTSRPAPTRIASSAMSRANENADQRNQRARASMRTTVMPSPAGTARAARRPTSCAQRGQGRAHRASRDACRRYGGRVLRDVRADRVDVGGQHVEALRPRLEAVEGRRPRRLAPERLADRRARTSPAAPSRGRSAARRVALLDARP